jgi:hypothetical protein
VSFVSPACNNVLSAPYWGVSAIVPVSSRHNTHTPSA